MKRRILAFVFWAIALMSAPSVGYAVTASVTVSINQFTYEAGETVNFGLSASKTSSVYAVDIYAGALLPDRQTVILILSGDPAFAIRNLSETGSWHPLIGGAGASGDWGVQLVPAARYTFDGSEPPGCYVGFAALVATENSVVALATANYSTGTTFVFDAGVPEEHQRLIRHTVGAATCFYGTHGLGGAGYVTLYALKLCRRDH